MVLVSGSFEPLLRYIQLAVDADHILCTEAEVIDGVYTGEIKGQPCIGEHKRDALLKYALLHHISLSSSFAYGDDVTDMQMIEAVGYGRQVESKSN